jgi:predicted glycoside hydrolase/deacetylase ChbG (UPF0249 family)
VIVTGPRRLVVNADDFGRSLGVNRGVIETFERGIVTSASLMVRYGAATEAAAEYARRHPDLGLGLHVDLGEWAYRGGEWIPVYELEPTTDEVAGQLEEFRRLVGREPTHLDSHQHVHRDEPARRLLLDLAASLGVPLRHAERQIAYCGAFYGRGEAGEELPDNISVEGLAGVLRGLPVGVTELCCHPAAAVDFDTDYASERLRERLTLCDPAVRRVVAEERLELCPFSGLEALGD